MIDLASQGWDLWMSRMWSAIWQGGLLALAAYLVTRWVPSLSPRTRTVIWWCVSAKLLVTLVATTPIRLGLLPTAGPATVVPRTAPFLANALPSRPAIVSLTPLSQAEFPWAVVWAVWLVGFLFLVKRLIQEHRNVSELIQRSHAITDPRLPEQMNALAAAMGLKQPVSLRSCVDLASPVIAGLRRPVIIFPASALGSLEEDPRNLALAHELAHLKRRDLLWSWVPILANALFWFFPASWLSLREYSQAREEACDAEALRVTRGQPNTYARLLLAFGTCHQPAAPIAACGASPHFHHLKRRLAMLQRFSVDRRDRGTFAFAAVGALLLVPIHVVAREARLSQAILVAEASAPAPPAPVPDIPPASPARAAVPPVLPIPNVMVKEINLIGAIKVPADDLKGVMFTRLGGTFREEIFQRDLTILQAAYYDRGFVDVMIDEPLVSISADKQFISISIKIEEGEAYSIGKLDFSGELLVSKEDLRKLMTSRERDLFNRSKLTHDISAFTDVYLDQGYADANITPVTQVHSEKRLVDLTFDFQKGRKVHIERIDLVGNTKTRDKVIRRELRVYEGELFSGTGLRESKERVTALGFFETVEVTHKPGSDDSKVVVQVEVKEKATPSANK